MAGTTTNHDQLMNAVYRNQRFIYDVTRKYYLLGRDRLIEGLDVPPGGSVLEVACGTGRNLIKAGRAYPDARLYGFDISTEMLTTARANLARAGMADRVQLIQADATDFSADTLFGQPAFDRVFISYSLSMIPDWQAALDCALRQTAPGGQLAVVDFSQQTDLPRWFSKGLLAWLAKFHVAPRRELPGAVTQLADRDGARAELSHLYRDYAVLGRIHRADTPAPS
jgi:S-adenosylmethionine-diacylgycerolhomoserine-N-methlytransferase